MSLDDVFPDGKEVTVQGRAVTVKKFELVRFKKAATLSKPIITAFFASGILDTDGEDVFIVPNWPLRILDIVAEQGDTLVDFLRFTLRMEDKEYDDFINSLDAGDGVTLVQAIVSVNWDFIKARIMPLLGVKVDTVQTGSTPSTPSSQQGTAEQT
jgi:hypothetical protein